MEGRKNDQEKLRYDLIPPELDAAVAAVLTYGAQKYEDRNWERGMAWSRPYGALKRHMDAWWGGENTDPETGMSHLWHAACCISFLIAYEFRETGADDRPKAFDPKEMWSPGYFEAVTENALHLLRSPLVAPDDNDILRAQAEGLAESYTPGPRQAVAERPKTDYLGRPVPNFGKAFEEDLQTEGGDDE